MLILLLDKYENCRATTTNLLTNEDALQDLSSYGVISSTSQSTLPTVQIYFCVTMWADIKTKYEWYVGYTKEMTNNGSYSVNHLQKNGKTRNKYPSQPDIHLVEDDQILETEVKGDWITGSRNLTFLLHSENEIVFAFYAGCLTFCLSQAKFLSVSLSRAQSK